MTNNEHVNEHFNQHTDENEIILDKASGISVEEQQEILSQINGIAEKNRLHLLEKAQGHGKDGRKKSINAKKSGAFFPLAVNIAAIIVLAAGAFILVHLNSQRNIQIRTGVAGYDIGLIGVQQETSDELASAMRELEHLATEQDRVNAIDALISGGLMTVSALIQEVQFDPAAEKVLELRNFLNMDTFAASSAFQSRRTFYHQLLDFADTLIDDARRQLDLIILVAEQEYTINNLQITIESLEADVDMRDQTIAARDGTITSLETLRDTLNQTIAARDGTITSLETHQTTLNQTIAARDSSIVSLETQRNTLNQTVAARDGTIAARDSTIASLQGEIVSLEQRIAELDAQLAAIRQFLLEN
ncbi:MAG: hypothetical protein FWC97_03110 [Treponema sp.]|nr:hypothetical protein [Treponema sp.]